MIIIFLELSSNYVMHFMKSGMTDYVKINGPEKDISEVRRCNIRLH